MRVIETNGRFTIVRFDAGGLIRYAVWVRGVPGISFDSCDVTEVRLWCAGITPERTQARIYRNV